MNRTEWAEDTKLKLANAEIAIENAIRELLNQRIDGASTMEADEIIELDDNIRELENIVCTIKEERNNLF